MRLRIVLDGLCLSKSIVPRKIERCSQSGFTLLEVLVAVLVLSFGMLGLAAMQLKGLQSSHLSYQRTLATTAANDAVERLWVKLWDAPESCPDPAVDVINEWHDAWSGLLVGMEVSSSITPASAGSCEYEIEVVWQDDRFSSENDISRLVYMARLPQQL